MIDSGSQSVGTAKAAPMVGKFRGREVPPGEIRTDDAGRLIVLGLRTIGVCRLAKRDAGCERLMSVPGMGPIICSAMVARSGPARHEGEF